MHKIIIILSIISPIFLANYSYSQDKLRIISPHWDGYRREIESGFIDYYKKNYNKEVKIEWLDLGGASDILRNLISRKQANAEISADVLFGGGIDTYLALQKEGFLHSALISENLLSQIPSKIGGNIVYDINKQFFSVTFTTFGIAYNKVLLDKLNLSAPSLYKDLASSNWRNRISFSDPRKSGTSRFMCELILQRYGWVEGWQILYKIASNVRSFAVHSSQGPKDISSGDAVAALMVDSYAYEAIRKMGEDRIKYKVPEDGNSYFGDPIALLASSTNKFLAEKFIEFVLSEEGGQSIVSLTPGVNFGPKKFQLSRLPVLPSVYDNPNIIRNEKPFSKKLDFEYDQNTATDRWNYLTTLLGILVDFHSDFVHARYTNDKDFSLLEPPIEEVQLFSLVNDNSHHKEKNFLKIQLATQKKLLEQLESKNVFSFKYFIIFIGLAWFCIKAYVVFLRPK